jgi:hypothetical protein
MRHPLPQIQKIPNKAMSANWQRTFYDALCVPVLENIVSSPICLSNEEHDIVVEGK